MYMPVRWHDSHSPQQSITLIHANAAAQNNVARSGTVNGAGAARLLFREPTDNHRTRTVESKRTHQAIAKQRVQTRFHFSFHRSFVRGGKLGSVSRRCSPASYRRTTSQAFGTNGSTSSPRWEGDVEHHRRQHTQRLAQFTVDTREPTNHYRR